MSRQLFTDEYRNKFKTIMLSLGGLRQTVEGIFIAGESAVPGEIFPLTLASGMPCTSDSTPGRFKKN